MSRKPVTHHISGIPFDECQRHWSEEPTSIAELYEWLANEGEQPLNVSHFIRNAHRWTVDYDAMRSHQARYVMLEQSQACRDARMGTVAPKDDHGGRDAPNHAA